MFIFYFRRCVTLSVELRGAVGKRFELFDFATASTMFISTIRHYNISKRKTMNLQNNLTRGILRIIILSASNT